jgi:hypothetical protein
MVEREDVQAAIEARKELGEEMEPHVIDAFLGRVEKRLERREEGHPERRTDAGAFVLGLVSLGTAIPLLGIVAGHGLAAIIAVCVALVLVNLVFRLR